MYPQKNPITIQSEIRLSQEQLIDALQEYLRRNNINVDKIISVGYVSGHVINRKA